MDYILVIYGPVMLLAIFGLCLILSKNIVVQLVAIAAPVILAGFEVLAIRPDAESDVPEILFVQAGALGILALLFLVILFLVRPELWRLGKEEAPRPTVCES